MRKMLLKNAFVHDGLGHVAKQDVLVEDGEIKQVADSLPGEGEDLSGCHLLPGFIDALSYWGINGSMTEIRPSSEDNDERSNPVTPELNVAYAFNGRACTVQQLPAFGITAVMVTPTDNNVFGGQMGVYTTHGVNPFKMCLKEKAGMKASVAKEVKVAYGKRDVAPLTRMKIFQLLSDNLRKAAEYDPSKEGVARDEKLAALHQVTEGMMPLWITCDSAEDRQRVMEIVAPYDKVRVVFTAAYGLDESDAELPTGKAAMIDGFTGMDCDPRAYGKRYDVLHKMLDKGIPVALSGMSAGMYGRECLLWEGMEMLKELEDKEQVLRLMTSDAAKVLGVDDVTGSIVPGKRADLVIWSENPLASFQAKVLRTLIAGETVYQEGDEMKCYI